MARLPVISGDEFVKVMHRIGYIWDHTEGSHMILLHPSGRRLSVAQTQRAGARLVKDSASRCRVKQGGIH